MTSDGRRVLLVTNRAPTTFARRGGALRVSRGAGGVVTALRHLVRWLPVTWVAVASGEGDLIAARNQLEHGGLLGAGRLTLRLVPMSPDLFAEYYGEFCGRVLWFAQHGIWDLRIDPEGPARLAALAGRYAVANGLVADAVVREMHRPGHARVAMFHDLHVYRAPQPVRERLAGAAVSHFLHVPWPELVVWRRAVPDEIVRALVEGLLSCDVVGFQDPVSRAAFAACAEELASGADASEELVRRGGRRTLLRVRPASIDPASLRPRLSHVERLRADGRLLLVRVDRSDPIKNVPVGFAAFERMLERRPELIGRARFLARVIPSRTSLPEYAREWELVRRGAARVNERFGAGTVELVERPDRGRGLAELAAADAVLVNSRADGMNLVAKEAAVLNERLALVLSRTAGAFRELQRAALGVDPLDLDGTAAAIEAALLMPEPERRARAAMARAAVLRWTARDWLRAQLDDLDELGEPLRPSLMRAV